MRKSTLSGVVGFLLSGVIAAGVCCAGFASRDANGKWFKNWNFSTWHWSDKAPVGDTENESTVAGSVQLSETESKGLKIEMRALAASEYRENDIDAQRVESAYTAKVTLANHSAATDKSITLTALFENGQSASEYISFSSSTVQSGEAFTISCIKAFGQPITIKATANGVESGEKPTCSIKADYVRRFKAIYMYGGEFYLENDGSLSGSYESYFEDLRLNLDGSAKGEMKVSAGDAAAAICIKAGDTANDISEGTITEGIKDLKIEYCPVGMGGQMWDITDSEINDLDKTPSNNASILFHYYGYDSDCMETLLNIINYAKSEAGSYAQALDKYNKREASFDLNVQFTGKITGIVYEFTTSVIINPAGLYTNAQNPSWDIGNIIF